MATKKIRLIDEDSVTTTETTGATFTSEQANQLMKYAEAIDWKMWEILKLLKEQSEK